MAVAHLLQTTGSDGFLNVPDHNDLASARVVVVPFGLEKTVSYGEGSNQGPAAIIAASHEVELYDPALGREAYQDYGVATLKPFPLPNDHQAALDVLAELTAALVGKKKFPLILGGEHSIFGGSAKGLAQALGRPCNILYFDAHTDLRPSFEGNPLSHASAVHIALPHINRIVQCGIRNTSLEEKPVIEQLQQDDRLKIFTAEAIIRHQHPDVPSELVAFLQGSPVYLSFDIDAFDIGIVGSSTGTPEPGGLSWYNVQDILRAAASHLNIVGAEFVEILPRRNHPAPDFAVAKLIYSFLNMVFATQGR